MDVQSLKLSKRTVIGKMVKQLRREGIVPVHVYGSGIEPHFFQPEALVLQKLLQRVGTNIPPSIDADELEGE